MKKITRLVALVMILSLSACATDSQNQYRAGDVGKEYKAEFGKIVAMREIKIQGDSTGAGTLAGGAAGAGLGNAIGHGGGRAGGTVIGLIAGAVIGGIAEHELQNQKGMEYTIAMHSGKIVSIAQNIAADDVPLKVGQRVIVQSSTDKKVNYRRVLPAEDMPESVKRPKDIKITD